MNKDKFIAKMLELGISQRESKVYLALLTKNQLTATEVAKISGIPRQKIYSILSNMVNNGMCKEKAGEVKKYQAVDPIHICNCLIAKYKEKENAANDLSKELADIYKENLQKIDPLEYIEILKNKLQIKRRVSEYVCRAQNSILVFSKSPYTTNFNENIDEDIVTIDKAVTIKSIYEYKDVKNENYIKEISSWISVGEEARVVKELPMKMIIIDEKVTICALNDPISLKPSITTMIINHAGFTNAQKHVFDNYWQRAIEFNEFINNRQTILKEL